MFKIIVKNIRNDHYFWSVVLANITGFNDYVCEMPIQRFQCFKYLFSFKERDNCKIYIKVHFNYNSTISCEERYHKYKSNLI